MHPQELNLPERRSARKAIIMSLLALALCGCEGQTPKPSANVQTEAPPPTTLPRSLPAPAPVLSRGDLVSAAGRAAAAYAAGEEREGTDPLVGRTFSIKTAFGCSGPTPALPEAGDAPGLASWSWGSEGKTIELKMIPGDWTSSALIVGNADAPAWEAVEGFWISRPWLMSESCPNVPGDPLQTANSGAAPQTLGLAAIFETGGSRIGRRNGRAYSFTVRQEGDTPLKPPAQGYRLVLEGRIAAYPDGSAIRCRAAGPDQRPVCVVATKLDRVAFEEPEGKALSEWRPA